MAYILNIETSGEICSVAVSNGGTLLSEAIGKEKNDHAAQLTLLIGEALKAASLQIKELDAVAVSAGPGSYTGLRIGTSTAKGICHGSGIPLISVPTLQSMAAGAAVGYDKEFRFCPLIDARRQEVFTAIYDNKGGEVLPPQPVIISQEFFSSALRAGKIVFWGSGLRKCEQYLQLEGATFLQNFSHTAKNLRMLSASKYLACDFASLMYFEPEYMKPVYTTSKPRA